MKQLNKEDIAKVLPYKLTFEELFQIYKSSPYGLSEEEAQKRYLLYGPNTLEEEAKTSILKLLKSQFVNFLVLLLIVAAFISYFLGEKISAYSILVIVLLAGLLGFIQEYQAERSLRELKKLIARTTKVIREGTLKEIPVEKLVPGDLVLLQAGDRVPADGRIIQATDLQVDEAILTGESFPVEKNKLPLLEENLPLFKQTNMLFMGTSILKGKGQMLVTSIGKNTEFGKIATLLKASEEKKTPLQVNLEKAGERLGFFIIILSTLIGIIGILKGYSLYEMFLLSVALAVALIPEALPAVTTITLALGVKRLAKKKVLVRRLPAVETLGAVTVICTDKTGTLTKNEMTVKKIFVNNKILEVTGVGYDPRGEILLNDTKYNHTEDIALFKLALGCILCNDSELLFDKEKGGYIVKGDPTEGALLVLGEKLGLSRENIISQFPRIKDIPFSSDRMRMTTLHSTDEGWYVFSKGALEVILNSCNFLLTDKGIEELSSELRDKFLNIAQSFYQSGLRVLAFAYKKYDKELLNEDLEKDLIFLGFVGMMDPPREEVKEAIWTCFQAGIKPIMITGDHKITAEVIGKEIGLYRGGIVISGEEMGELKEENWEEIVDKLEIFARALPENKLTLVKLLQKKGHIVAMTGDGVNDAPALKEANIGIAMGQTGTEVAKEVSSMILLEENFAYIVKAIEEGRTIFANIRKFLTYLMTGNFATVTGITLSILLGWPLPLTALQILFINLLMDGAPAIALGLERPEPDIMKKPPRNPKENILNKQSLFFIFFMGLFIALLVISIYFYYLKHSTHLKAQSIFFTAIILFRFINAFNCRSLENSLFKIGFFTNKWLWISLSFSLLLLIIVLYTPLNKIFEVTPLSAKDWLILSILGLSILIFALLMRQFLNNLTKLKIRLN